jgi:hypothetical protein
VRPWVLILQSCARAWDSALLRSMGRGLPAWLGLWNHVIQFQRGLEMEREGQCCLRDSTCNTWAYDQREDLLALDEHQMRLRATALACVKETALRLLRCI